VNTANDAVLAEGRRVLIEDPHRFDGVRVIGVDEHCWRHTRRGDKYVTVIIDLTPIRDGTGPARLLDMVEGRSKQVFKTWLGERDTSWRDGVEAAAASSRSPAGTAAARATRSMPRGAPSTPAPRCSPRSSKPVSKPCSRSRSTSRSRRPGASTSA